MDKGLLPRRYAKALYKYADEKGRTAQVYDLMQNLNVAFDTNHDLQSTIANPFVPTDNKIALLSTAAGEKNDILDDFVKLLAVNNRLDIVRGVALAYTALYRQENHIHLVEITSAAPLNDADKKRITDMIEKHIGNATAQYSFHVDPELIGGFVIKIDNESLDASVRNELKQLRQALITK